MALSEGENMVMPVTPMGGYGNGNGCFGGDYWWIILRREAQTFIERMERR